MTKILLIFLFLIVSCGNSPLFNHKNQQIAGLGSSLLAQSAEIQHFQRINYSVVIDWIQGPRQGGENKFTLRSWDHDSGSVSGPYQNLPLKLHVLLWMPSMGHGSAPVKINKVAEGEYEISDVYFIMAGKWEVKVQLLKDGKVFDEVVFPYTL